MVRVRVSPLLGGDEPRPRRADHGADALVGGELVEQRPWLGVVVGVVVGGGGVRGEGCTALGGAAAGRAAGLLARQSLRRAGRRRRLGVGVRLVVRQPGEPDELDRVVACGGGGGLGAGVLV